MNNWPTLSSIIVRSGAQLGLTAGGGSMTMAEFHNPGRVGQIGIEMFGRTVALAEGMRRTEAWLRETGRLPPCES